MSEHKAAAGPDFTLGVAVADIVEGATLAGRVGDKPVLLSRRGGAFFAVSGACTHYGAPLSDGLIEGDQVRCPWHHACFSLRTGEALAAPAFDALPCWTVEVVGERVFVRTPKTEAALALHYRGKVRRIVIVGGGAAGFAAADTLRRRGFAGELTMLSADASPPCDRPNLSKDYLAGTAPEEWIPLKDDAFYRERQIDLRLGVSVRTLDPRQRVVTSASGEAFPYDVLLLATGASPIRLPQPDFARENVHTLRSLADARAIIDAAAQAHTVAIVGASFIGLETAAALRTRGLQVDVVAPESVPLERVMGVEIGRFVRALHEQSGARFHLGRTAESFDGRRLKLSDGSVIDADLVVLGVGVRPNIDLARSAGLANGNGVLLDQYLSTSAPEIFAAGDIAEYPDARLAERIRVEHWVAAERQGQTAALNMLGERERFCATPFFWSNHYGQAIRYVGYAKTWDSIEIDGSIEAGDFTARFIRNGRLLAAASLGRDRESLDIHAAMDREASR
ncbi:MAG: FAD-dependent oxidoreductase [Hyphomonadaceae bacterium]